MNNHLHIIIEGNRDITEKFFDILKVRMQHYFIKQKRCVDLKQFKCKFVAIDNLNTLRNEIAYTNRNGYVVRPDCTPFSYPWGAGALFFNPFIKLIPFTPFSALSVKAKRALCHTHRIDFDSSNLKVYEGVILPSSFCKIAKAESMYRDAHHYFHLISKGLEAFSEIANRLHEKVMFSDEEMYTAISNIAFKQHSVRQPSLIPARDKIELAKKMHYEFNASNRQIKNILKIDEKTVNELFPK